MSNITNADKYFYQCRVLNPKLSCNCAKFKILNQYNVTV